MSTTIKGFTVTLERDIREESAERIADAIRLTVGVIGVKLIEETPQDWMVRTQVRSELQSKLYEALKDK